MLAEYYPRRVIFLSAPLLIDVVTSIRSTTNRCWRAQWVVRKKPTQEIVVYYSQIKMNDNSQRHITMLYTVLLFPLDRASEFCLFCCAFSPRVRDVGCTQPCVELTQGRAPLHWFSVRAVQCSSICTYESCGLLLLEYVTLQHTTIATTLTKRASNRPVLSLVGSYIYI